jgi:integrase
VRPSELDALRWERIDLVAGEVELREAWNAKTRTFAAPKYGPYTIALIGRARDVLLRMKHDAVDSPFVFTTLRGTHYTPSARSHHWNRVRAAAGLGNTSLYFATRHACASYALNVLGLPPHVIAHQLGHRDGPALRAPGREGRASADSGRVRRHGAGPPASYRAAGGRLTAAKSHTKRTRTGLALDG